MEDFPPPGFIPTESVMPGITLYMPAPKVERLDEVVDFRCPQCGGETAYSAAGGGLTCTYCGYHEAPKHQAVGRQAESFEFTVATVERASNGWGVERKQLQCQNCGSQISIPPGALTTTCPFCGSNKVIHYTAPQDVLRPRFLIPFKIETDRCYQIAREWLGSTWLVPGQLRRLAAVQDFTPIFLPFWTFAAETNASWRAEVGHRETYRDSRGRTRSRIVWRWESGRVHKSYKDLLERGTDHASPHLLKQIRPYKLEALAAYEPQYLAGIHAQAYETKLEEAWEKARGRMREDTREDCRSQASTNRIRNFTMQLDFQEESWRYILLPVYINTYFYENKPFQLLINGQTGKIAGQRPADWRKISLVAAALTLPGILIFLALYFFFLGLFGNGGALLSFLLFAAGLAVAIYIALQAQKLDDI